MWIFDSRVRRRLEFWAKEGSSTRRIEVPFRPSFYLRLDDPHRHRELLEGLEERFPVEECTFRTIHGPVEGYRVEAGRRVAEAIERQAGFGAELYNVDIRQDQRWMAEQGRVPCASGGESRFSLEFGIPLRVLRIRIPGDPARAREIRRVELRHEGGEVLEGEEREVLRDLFASLHAQDPDVILMPDADLYVRRIVERASCLGLEETLSRGGGFREIDARSYWSYGRVEYRGSALLPEGRVLIDTRRSFNYREGGLEGVLLASRLSGIAPALASRLTPGTLVSSYEVYEALLRGIAVPFRKRDAEAPRRIVTLRELDRGGMILQPFPGVHTHVDQLDFTSLYPAIIVRYNLSPETLRAPGRRGFLPEVLHPLLELRREAKRRKREEERCAGLDSILKWMLVTCFGYTGYRNAKFGSIEVHEQITCRAREILLRTKEIAEGMGYEVLHGIVDSLWVRGREVEGLKARVEGEIGIGTECEHYDWIVFLPMSDGAGAYNRYYGRRSDGSMRLRGIMARRGDTPPLIARMQEEVFGVLSGAGTPGELLALEGEAKARYRECLASLPSAAPGELAIARRIGRSRYSRRCAEGAAVQACARAGLRVEAGMEVAYVVEDAATWEVSLPEEASRFDLEYYRGLMEKAWEEIAFAFRWIRAEGAGAEVAFRPRGRSAG